VQPQQSPFLAMISDSKVNQTLKQMGHPAGDHLTPEITREVCQRAGGKAMLTGSIAALGTHYVVGLEAVNCNTGEVLAGALEQAGEKETVIKALDAAAISLRSKLGESLSTVQKYSTPLEEATTPSLEALKTYSRQSSNGDPADAARVKARAAYQDFLTIWREADPDVPILKEAKAEYAKLQ
jgi:eukaryotic-like serine/threonine-protein kinase